MAHFTFYGKVDRIDLNTCSPMGVRERDVNVPIGLRVFRTLVHVHVMSVNGALRSPFNNNTVGY